MTACACVAIGCESKRHVDLECGQPATRRVRSRDWDERVYPMCSICGAAAIVGGMFTAVARGEA